MSYLQVILNKYQARSLVNSSFSINQLKAKLSIWAGSCYIATLDSGSRAKGTAISLASDVDYLLSLSNGCNESKGGLKYTYEALYEFLKNQGYGNVRKQNVSTRITLNGLEVDITPATKHPGYTNDHSIWLSKKGTWQKTNIQKHIDDISLSGRTSEIRLLKIWRELNHVEFPSIYLEYLLLSKILLGRSTDSAKLSDNFYYVLTELAREVSNPLYSTVLDPANSANILSDLITPQEKSSIKASAKVAISKTDWSGIVW